MLLIVLTILFLAAAAAAGAGRGRQRVCVGGSLLGRNGAGGCGKW